MINNNPTYILQPNNHRILIGRESECQIRTAINIFNDRFPDIDIGMTLSRIQAEIWRNSDGGCYISPRSDQSNTYIIPKIMRPLMHEFYDYFTPAVAEKFKKEPYDEIQLSPGDLIIFGQKESIIYSLVYLTEIVDQYNLETLKTLEKKSRADDTQIIQLKKKKK